MVLILLFKEKNRVKSDLQFFSVVLLNKYSLFHSFGDRKMVIMCWDFASVNEIQIIEHKDVIIVTEIAYYCIATLSKTPSFPGHFCHTPSICIVICIYIPQDTEVDVYTWMKSNRH